MNPSSSIDELENALYRIERLINFHQEEEFQEDFPRLRSALADARQSVQALDHLWSCMKTLITLNLSLQRRP